MPILKKVLTGEVISQAHRIMEAKIRFDGPEPVCSLVVHSYPTEEDAKKNLNLNWQEYPTIVLSDFDPGDPLTSFEQALVAGDNIFSGGTVIASEPESDLAAAKTRKWAQIKDLRTSLERGGFEVPDVGIFDSDAKSRSTIQGMVLAASIALQKGQAFSLDYTLKDNSVVRLDAETAVKVGFALLAHLDAVHQRSRELYLAIEEAETIEELNEIKW